MKVSIIMPVYNNENYLHTAVSSIINQSYENWELLIVDDGSTDKTGEICDTYSVQDSRIKVFHEKNQGPSTARNIGIDYSLGEYCLFIDSDDYLETNALELLINSVKDRDYDVVFYGYYDRKISNNVGLIKEEKTALYKVYEENNAFKKDYVFYDSINYTHPIWNKMYNLNFIKKNNVRYPTDVYNSGDFIFNLRVFEIVEKLLVLNYPLYNYVNHSSGSITTKFKLEKLASYERIYMKAYKIMEAWNPNALNLLNNEYLTNISAFINSLFNDECYLSRGEKKNIVKKILIKESVRKCIDEVKPMNQRNKVMKFLLNHDLSWLLLSTGRASRIKKKFIDKKFNKFTIGMV